MNPSRSSKKSEDQKPILKSESKETQTNKKATHAKFDERNILETFHPPEKDYGHMKIQEPPTPYHAKDNRTPDPADVTKKLLEGDKKAKAVRKTEQDNKEDEDETRRKGKFEEKRKEHYDEYKKVTMARKLMEEEEEQNQGPSTSKKI